MVLFKVLVSLVVCQLGINAWTVLNNPSRRSVAWNFPQDGDPPTNGGQLPNGDGLLERQTFPATFPTGNQYPFNNLTNFIVTAPTAAAGQTCICVPTGTCNNTALPQPSDGSGLLDFRIVTNAANVAVPTPVVTTPAGGCGIGLVVCCQPGPYQCGVRYPPVANSPTPAAGQAPYGAYPWQAALLGPGDAYLASGVLINGLNVVTVAHSVSAYVNSPSSLKVRLGEWNAAGINEPIVAQNFAVSRITLHPNYNSNNLKNDVAVLRLTATVPLGQTPTIATVCLPSIAFTGSRCWVSGWGRNAFSGGTYQTILKHVDVPILQSSVCQSELAATRLGAGFVFDTNSFICAGGEVSKDACTGDGGSPLVCQLGNQWFVAGLVTWGIGCGTSNVPGVYVNMQTYLPWIQTVV